MAYNIFHGIYYSPGNSGDSSSMVLVGNLYMNLARSVPQGIMHDMATESFRKRTQKHGTRLCEADIGLTGQGVPGTIKLPPRGQVITLSALPAPCMTNRNSPDGTQITSIPFALSSARNFEKCEIMGAGLRVTESTSRLHRTPPSYRTYPY